MIITIIVLIPSIKTKSEFYYLFLLDGLLVVFPIFIFMKKSKILLLYTGGTIGMIENP